MQLSFEFREWNTRSSVFTNPSLDYLAPEYILSKTCSQASDIFSFGMLCFAVYNEGRPLFSNHNNVLSFNQNAEQVCLYVSNRELSVWFIIRACKVSIIVVYSVM